MIMDGAKRLSKRMINEEIGSFQGSDGTYIRVLVGNVVRELELVKRDRLRHPLFACERTCEHAGEVGTRGSPVAGESGCT